MMLGSCFAANVGEKLRAEGYDVCVNPFGTLFNPVSIRNSISRLANPRPFTEEECVMMGAGADKWCSWSHYTLFARPAKEDFLRNANEALEQAASFYRKCDTLVLTFGTAWCFRHLSDGVTVSNCLKRPAREFERYLLNVKQIAELYRDIDKNMILTVSPIRHLADGLHGNQLSKSTLLLACDEIVAAGQKSAPGDCGAGQSFAGSLAESDRQPFAGSLAESDRQPRRAYFPAYEIMMDELRDYRFYASDGVHPSEEAVAIIADRFLNDFLPKF